MKSYKKLIVIVFALSFFGCEDYLNRYPLNNPSDVTFLSNETELKMAVAGCYSTLWYNFEGMPFHLCLDAASDIEWDRNGSTLQAVGRGSVDSRNGLIVAFWTNMYAGIAKCNYVLANMERGKSVIPEAAYNQYESEVRFLRALFYSYLVELYGGVPLVETPLTLSEAQMPRNSKEEVVKLPSSPVHALDKKVKKSASPTVTNKKKSSTPHTVGKNRRNSTGSSPTSKVLVITVTALILLYCLFQYRH